VNAGRHKEKKNTGAVGIYNVEFGERKSSEALQGLWDEEQISMKDNIVRNYVRREEVEGAGGYKYRPTKAREGVGMADAWFCFPSSVSPRRVL